MAGETTCPHCGGPAEHISESVEWPIVDAVGNPYGLHRMPTTRYRSTAADPAQVQAMRELLREIEWAGVIREYGDSYPGCLICDEPRGVGHKADCRLAKLLEGGAVIPIGTFVELTPTQGICIVFANHGSYIGLERLIYPKDSPRRYFWVEEKAVQTDEPPSEEEALG